MTDGFVARAGALVDDYLLVWVLLAVGVGLAVPDLAALDSFSTPILAVMIGSVSLTLAPDRFRRLHARTVLAIVLAQAGMPLLAFAIARALSLSPALIAGFVVLGAVTPELVAPTMTELGGGDTALATVVLVVVGLASVAFVPGVAAVLLRDAVAVDPLVIVEPLALAVVAPMTIAIAARARFPDRVERYDDHYPSIAGLMVVVLIGIVAAANAALVLDGGTVLARVALGALALNLTGYLAGWLLGPVTGRVTGHSFSRPERIAATLSVGMRDFAVAAALLVAAGFPTAATLPAVAFGIVEMTTSAGLAKWFRR